MLHQLGVNMGPPFWVSSGPAGRGAVRPLGAKHPLLSLCCDDLVAAWGPETRFIWSWRPLDQSISGLQRRRWFGGHAESLQRRLWDELSAFEARRGDVVRLDFARMKADPSRAVRELASLAGIVPADVQVQAAAGFIKVGPELPRS